MWLFCLSFKDTSYLELICIFYFDSYQPFAPDFLKKPQKNEKTKNKTQTKKTNQLENRDLETKYRYIKVRAGTCIVQAVVRLVICYAIPVVCG